MNNISVSKVRTNGTILYISLSVIVVEPTSHVEVVKHVEQKNAMDIEYDALIKNKICT